MNEAAVMFEYPDDMEQVLRDLRGCIDALPVLEGYYERILNFADPFF